MLTSKEGQSSGRNIANSPDSDDKCNKQNNMIFIKKQVLVSPQVHSSYLKFLPHSPSIAAFQLALLCQPRCLTMG